MIGANEMDNGLRNARLEQAYAIVRVDLHQNVQEVPEHAVVVKKIVWSQETAEREVERLNAQRPADSVRYFWQITRLEPVDAEHDPSTGAALGEPVAMTKL